MLTVHLESIALPVMQPAHYVRRPALFPIGLPFFKLDVAPIVQIAHADWLQSLRELVPHSFSFFSVVCVFYCSCRVATGGSVIWEEARRANILIPPSVDGYVHILPKFLDLKRTLCLIITGYPTSPVSPLHLAFYVLILCQPLFCT